MNRSPPEPKLAGFVIVDLQPAFGREVEHEDEKMPEIDWLIVAPEWQGQGRRAPPDGACARLD